VTYVLGRTETSSDSSSGGVTRFEFEPEEITVPSKFGVEAPSEFEGEAPSSFESPFRISDEKARPWAWAMAVGLGLTAWWAWKQGSK
jgi:hypothetical protein